MPVWRHSTYGEKQERFSMVESGRSFISRLCTARGVIAKHRRHHCWSTIQSEDVALRTISIFPKCVFWSGWNYEHCDRLHRIQHCAKKHLRIYWLGFICYHYCPTGHDMRFELGCRLTQHWIRPRMTNEELSRLSAYDWMPSRIPMRDALSTFVPT